jgi:hypothetical protein
MSHKPSITDAQFRRAVESICTALRRRRLREARRMRKSLWRRMGIPEYRIPDDELKVLLAKLPVNK